MTIYSLKERHGYFMDCFELDVHTHSVSSGHYTEDTVTDMIKHASGIGLKLLGISEHGPKQFMRTVLFPRAGTGSV